MGREINPISEGKMAADFDYDSVGAGYYDHMIQRKGVRSYWHRNEFATIEALVRDNPEMSILDVGCAAGSFFGTFTKPFRRAVGIDISKAQTDFAQKKYGSDRVRFVTGDARSYDFGGETFDCVVVSEVIEHFSYADGMDILRKTRRLLKPGGQIIVTTPNYHSHWPFVEFLVNRLTPVSYEHQHINKLHRAKMASMLRDAGYTVEKTATFFIVGPFLAFFSWRLASAVCRLETKLFPSLGLLMVASAKL